jgi:hypothetical protein
MLCRIGQLKDAHASFLPHLVALTALELSYCRSLSAEGLQQLRWLLQLRALNLMAVGSEDLSCLRALQQLTALTVRVVMLLLYELTVWWLRVSTQ